MLNQPAPFPHPGSSAFIAAAAPDLDPRECRVVQHSAPGLCPAQVTVALVRLPGELGIASHTITVLRSELFEHMADAMPAAPRRRKVAR